MKNQHEVTSKSQSHTKESSQIQKKLDKDMLDQLEVKLSYSQLPMDDDTHLLKFS